MSAIVQAYQLYKAGRLPDAQGLLQAHLKRAQNDAKALHLLAIVLKGQGELDGAMDAIEKAHKASPSDANILLEKAQIFRDAGQIEIAVQASEELLDLTPGQLQASLIAGNYWLSQDFPERALKRFEAGLKTNPEHEKLAFGRIFALKDLGQQDRAWSEIKRLGSPPELLYTMGHLHMENFEPEKAKSAFLTSLEAGMNMSLAARDYCQCCYMTGGRAALDAAINDLVSGYPDRGDFQIQIAHMMTEIGDTDEALKVIEKAGAIPGVDRTKAAAFLKAGQTDKAMIFAEQALEETPHDIGAAMHFARAALGEGNALKALNLADKYLLTDKEQSSYWLAIKTTALRLQGAEKDYADLVDYDQMLGVYDLEVPDGYSSLNAFMAALKKHLISLHEWNEAPLFQSLRNGTQTTRDLRHDKAPVMTAFFSAIDKCIRDYMAKMPVTSDHPFYSRLTRSYRMSGAWSVVLKPGGFHVDHIHPKGWISSSFYVDVPESVADHPDKAGWIKFGEPPIKLQNLGPEKHVCPKPGRLVLFPSYFWHGTVPFDEGEQRITLPFDLMPLD